MSYKVLPSGERPASMHIASDGSIVLKDSSGSGDLAVSANSSTVMSAMVILHLTGIEVPYGGTFFFSRDNVYGQKFRRLKVILRWKTLRAPLKEKQ